MPFAAQQLPIMPASGIVMLGQLGSTFGAAPHEFPIIMPHVPTVSSAQQGVPPSGPEAHVFGPHLIDITIAVLPPVPLLVLIAPPLPVPLLVAASVEGPASLRAPPSIAMAAESSSPQASARAQQNTSKLIE
jgi:hypothetical protein